MFNREILKGKGWRQIGNWGLTSEFNEVAGGDLGGETCKVSEPLNSCQFPSIEVEF
jgi:hypothetical protein